MQTLYGSQYTPVMRGVPRHIINHKSQIINLKSRGFTLLEVLLSLALTALITMAVATAIYVHLRAVDSGRADVEEAQLARALLARIADDLRGAVAYNPIQADQVAAQASSSSGTSSSGGTSSGGGSGGSSSSGGTSGGTGSGGTSSSGGASSGGSSGSSSSGGTSSGSASSGSSSGSSDSSSPAASIVPATMPGVYGDNYTLQVDVSRLPRLDQIESLIASGGQSPTGDRLSDVKTVTYYVNNGGGAGLYAGAGGANQQSGLVRCEMDRAVTAFAANNGGLDQMTTDLAPIAPEVAAIQFQYYDGSQLLDQWDTVQQGGLPVAVQVTLVLTPATVGKKSAAGAAPTPTGVDLLSADPAHVYTMLVYLHSSGAGKGSSSSSQSSGTTSSDTADSSSSGASSGASADGSSSASGTSGSGSSAGAGTGTSKSTGSSGTGSSAGAGTGASKSTGGSGAGSTSGSGSGASSDPTKKATGR